MIVRVGGYVAFWINDRVDLVKQRLIRHDRDNIIGVIIRGRHTGFAAELQQVATGTRIWIGGIINVFGAVAFWEGLRGLEAVGIVSVRRYKRRGVAQAQPVGPLFFSDHIAVGVKGVNVLKSLAVGFNELVHNAVIKGDVASSQILPFNAAQRVIKILDKILILRVRKCGHSLRNDSERKLFGRIYPES